MKETRTRGGGLLKNKGRKRNYILVLFYGIVFGLSMIPIVLVAPYVRATGDDLNYSAVMHQALLNGGGIIAFWNAIWATVRGTWYSWQGTWSSVALFSLQPGILGDQWYPLTVAVALFCVLGGTWYFLHVVGRMRGIKPGLRWSICFLIGTVIIQYMPNMKCGIFWWTSVAHYCIPYGIVLFCMGWSLRWLKTGYKRFMAGILLGMAYLGGAGYPEVVLAAVWFFFIPFIALLYRKTWRSAVPDECARIVKRAGWLWIPFAAEMIGFAFSAIAPGNKNRGGEDFGFSASKVVWTLLACVKEGICETARYFVQVRVLAPFLILVILLLLLNCEGTRENYFKKFPTNWKEWLPAGVGCAAIICLVRAPVLYAGTDASGGVPDSYWFITVVAVVVWLEIFLTPDVSNTWIKVETGCDVCVGEGVEGEQDPSNKKECHNKVIEFAMVGVIVIMLAFSRHLIGNSVDYTCIQFIQSGALADYHSQMEEWLDILNDPAVSDAKLPEMNSEQGPFMMMVPLDNAEAWSSQVYARYYGKNSVICVPRS